MSISHRQHGQDKDSPFLSVSAVWNRHYTDKHVGATELTRIYVHRSQRSPVKPVSHSQK